MSLRDIEVFDALSGLILDRDSGHVLRQVAVDMRIKSTELNLLATFNNADGKPDGAPVKVATTWSTGSPFSVGGFEPWEKALNEVELKRKRIELAASGRFRVFRGGASDRADAVAYIRHILHSLRSQYVKIWDPYFGPRDMYEFLFYVPDPRIRIRVLTALEPTDAERQTARSARSTLRAQVREAAREAVARVLQRPTPGNARVASLFDAVGTVLGPKPQTVREWKRQQTRRVLSLLREPEPGKCGLRDVVVRTGGAAFHDRFIIASGKCWQLGTSFNHIGSVMSTVQEFPHPEMIEAEFDEAWNKANDVE